MTTGDMTNDIMKWGVGVADVVKASSLVVYIDPVVVRVPAVAATKMDIGVTPHRRWPNSPNRM